MTFDQYKQDLLTYLTNTKACEDADIAAHEQLTEQEKIDEGYLIKNPLLVNFDTATRSGEFLTPVNNTRWRIGDKVACETLSPLRFTGQAYVMDNFSDRIFLTDVPMFAAQKVNGKYLDVMFYMKEASMTPIFINAIDAIEQGKAGAAFLKTLGGISKPLVTGYLPINPDSVKLLNHLNEKQREAYENVLKGPSTYIIQGPPGTGKTDVLAAIANAYSNNGLEVLIISYSHQAANNALNKVAKYNVPTFKIGGEYKSTSLDSNIQKFVNIKEYKNFRKKNKQSRNSINGDVVGMTLHGAIINFALHANAFSPSIILVDEASQIPLAYAAAIGAIGAATHVFIGDNYQMPPIFYEQMKDDRLSISIFEHLNNILPSDLKTVLTTTFRMNREICNFVSYNFYEPHGIKLSSHDSISNRCVQDEDIRDSIEFINVYSQYCQDENILEADTAVQKALYYKNKGLDIAIITPFRKQVNLIREKWNQAGYNTNDTLIDTVERLQGQDVDVIVLSMVTSDVKYYNQMDSFLMDRNRLNVMISRAKRKVIIIKSQLIKFNHYTHNIKVVPSPKVNSTNEPEPVIPMFEIEGEPQEVRDARKRILDEFGDLEFYEKEHKYLLHGKKLESVSGIGHRFESRPFDSDYQAKAYARKHGQTPEYWLKMWALNSFRATSMGTKTHEFGESLAYLKAEHPEFMRPSVALQYNDEYNYLAPIHPKEEAAEAFLNELPSCYHLVLNETRVYSGKNPDESKNLKEQLCGTFDMLYWYDGDGDKEKAGFVVFDYKTNSSLYDDFNQKYNIKLLSPFQDFYQESFGIYTIQLGLYSLMIEDIGLNVIDRQLIWLKGDGTYEKVPVPNVIDRLRRVL